MKELVLHSSLTLLYFLDFHLGFHPEGYLHLVMDLEEPQKNFGYRNAFALDLLLHISLALSPCLVDSFLGFVLVRN